MTKTGMPFTTAPPSVRASPSLVLRLTAASTPRHTPMRKLIRIPDSARITVHGNAEATMCATGVPSCAIDTPRLKWSSCHM